MDLNIFKTENLYQATVGLFQQLGIKLNSNTAKARNASDTLKEHYKKEKPVFQSIMEVYFAGLVEDSIFQDAAMFDGGYTLEQARKRAKKTYEGLMLFAVKLDYKPKRSEIAELTRAFNRRSKEVPVGLLFCYEIDVHTAISLALPERFFYKQTWRVGEKVGKVIVLRDILVENTHAGHLRILQDLAGHNAKNFNELHEVWLKALDVNVLNKSFYKDLMKWYNQCLANIDIDLEAASKMLNKKIDDELKPQAVIRIIIRLMFMWFMKEKGLMDKKFFDKGIKSYLKKENTYYNAILQNLFFAVLNKKIDERRFRKQDKNNRYAPALNDYGIFDVFRYKDMFKDGKADEFLTLTKTIPFVNGGLFACHDYKFCGKDVQTNEKNTKENYIIDGFSDNSKDRATVSDDVIFELIALFDKYVFTIEESTPFEQDIALDPELLGTVFENLIGNYNPETKENARKATGSFYTPREIVDYMCKESFKEALKTKLPELKVQIDSLIDNAEDKLDFPQKNNVIAAITSLKVLDPACGSGAFPMGMFNLMVQNIEKLQEHKTTYKNKLDIITNCIYGVDIQNIAVEISKLRFFISLLVDYQTPEKIEEFDVLPNLETKFVVANSLIGIDTKQVKGYSDFTDQFKELTEILTPYMQAKSPKEKEKIKNAFNKKKQEIVSHQNFKFTNIKDMIEQWNPFNVCYCSPFFDSAIMFGIVSTASSRCNTKSKDAFDTSDGFDVVIGNPPYVSLQKMKEMSAVYSKCGYESFASTGDIYCLFIERGVQLLKDGGRLCYITSNKWMRAGYGEALRRFLSSKTKIELLVDFSGIKVFESATVDVDILLAKKDNDLTTPSVLRTATPPKEGNFKCSPPLEGAGGGLTTACQIGPKDFQKDTNISEYVKSHSVKMYFPPRHSVLDTESRKEEIAGQARNEGKVNKQARNEGESWVILSPLEAQIKSKIENAGTPLKDWDIQINYGIKTGYNEAFIIDGATKDALIAADKRSAEIIRPILRGRDIKRYGYEFADKWLIFIPWHFPLHKDTTISGASKIAEKEFEKQYPAIYNHLLKHKDDLSKRNTAETGIRYEWYALQRCAATYWQEFDKEKVVYSEIVQEPRFYLDKIGEFYPEATSFIMTGEHLSYLCALLHSKAVTFAFKRYYAGGGLGETGYRYKKAFIENLPIPVPTPETEAEITSLVESILSLNHDFAKINKITKKENAENNLGNQANLNKIMVQTLENEIDKLVYGLYGLTDEEIAVVEGRENG